MISYPNVKLNLGLHILRKRADGYHDLETLFIPYFAIRDTLEIVQIPGKGEAVFKPSASVTWDNDLTVRAYNLLSERFDLPSVEIRLDKQSPVGAGLGGGSSDAAFTLKMLNEMFSLGLSEDALALQASRLGSDCAFFIYNRPMLGKGRGEILEPFEIDLSGYELSVHIPQNISVSTAEAYRGITPRYGADELPSGGGLASILSQRVEKWRGSLVNDFEKTVFALHPELSRIKEELYLKGAVYASMSGSGSALFALFPKTCR